MIERERKEEKEGRKEGRIRVANWTYTVPGQAPLKVIPAPKISPPMMLPPYPFMRPRPIAELLLSLLISPCCSKVVITRIPVAVALRNT